MVIWFADVSCKYVILSDGWLPYDLFYSAYVLLEKKSGLKNTEKQTWSQG